MEVKKLKVGEDYAIRESWWTTPRRATLLGLEPVQYDHATGRWVPGRHPKRLPLYPVRLPDGQEDAVLARSIISTWADYQATQSEAAEARRVYEERLARELAAAHARNRPRLERLRPVLDALGYDEVDLPHLLAGRPVRVRLDLDRIEEAVHAYAAGPLVVELASPTRPTALDLLVERLADNPPWAHNEPREEV